MYGYRDIKMHYYIYKITNLLNGNFYIGRRCTRDSIDEDTYFGSGKRLKDAIRKYGVENFNKEILKVCESYDELIHLEKEIVTEELVRCNQCYNLALGGHGGYTFYKNRNYKHTNESKEKISRANTGRKRLDLVERNKQGFNMFWNGRKRTQEDKQKKSVAAKKRVENSSTDFAINIQCPHCGKIGQSANMKRWHFDRCKSLLEQTP